MRLESTGVGSSKRLVNGEGTLLAMAEQYSCGNWAVHNYLGHEICLPRHTTATKALRWYEEYNNPKEF